MSTNKINFNFVKAGLLDIDVPVHKKFSDISPVKHDH